MPRESLQMWNCAWRPHRGGPAGHELSAARPAAGDLRTAVSSSVHEHARVGMLLGKLQCWSRGQCPTAVSVSVGAGWWADAESVVCGPAATIHAGELAHEVRGLIKLAFCRPAVRCQCTSAPKDMSCQIMCAAGCRLPASELVVLRWRPVFWHHRLLHS
jgi:hypothetical protein